MLSERQKEVKQVKKEYNLAKKNNLKSFQEERKSLIKHIIEREFPNWGNILFTYDKTISC